VIAIGSFLFRYRNALFPLSFALVFLPGARILAHPGVALAFGASIALAGQALRALTIGLKYIVRGGRARRVYAKDLVTDGMYAHTRNPMYVANLVILSGIAVASNSWACVAVALPVFAFCYACIVAAEEEFLRARFSDAFDAYAAEVPRWRMRFRGLGQTLAATRFSWRRVLVKEYGTPVAWIAGLSLFGLIRGIPGDESLTAVFYAILVVTGIFWIFARWLKKARIVVGD
jgi:protein-S-isoprenylcysteine O-methyltransferase Ste14